MDILKQILMALLNILWIPISYVERLPMPIKATLFVVFCSALVFLGWWLRGRYL